MADSNGGFLHNDPANLPARLPLWFSNSNENSNVRPPSPSVTLSLSPSSVAAVPPIPWLQPERGPENAPLVLGNLQPHGSAPISGEALVVSELMECCRELEEGHHVWAAHKKKAVWRLRRVVLQLESEKACRRREKMEEIEAKVKALMDEQMAALDKIEAEYKEQLTGLRRDAEAKEQKLSEQWSAKHLRLTKFLEQMGSRPRLTEPDGR